MAGIAPAMPVYTNDMLGSAACFRMTNEEFGAYHKLLYHQWNTPECGLPDDPEVLAQLCGLEPHGQAMIKLMAWFPLHPKNKSLVANPRCYEVREKMLERRKTLSEAGQKGAARRWNNKKNARQKPSDSQANDGPMAKPCVSSSFSSSSTVCTHDTKNQASPIVSDCTYFRASGHERQLSEEYYRKNQIPIEWLDLAVRVVDDWMTDGTSGAARAARKQPTHYRRLYASWVLEKIEKVKRVAKNSGGTKSAVELYEEMKNESRRDTSVAGLSTGNVAPVRNK